MKKKKDMKKPLLAAVLACSMVQIPAIPVAAAAPENLALNQTVTASSYEQPTNNPEKTSPSKAVDGDLTTRWGTAQNLAANEWINVNLGSSKQIQQININFERTKAKRSHQTDISGQCYGRESYHSFCRCRNDQLGQCRNQ